MADADKTYWLDAFTGTTWKEFRAAGADITGFRASRSKLAAKIKPGDVFICYMTGVKRWVGALEVIEPTTDGGEIWSVGTFPVRFRVKPLILLTPETGVPMEHLLGKVWFFAKPTDAPGYKAFVRGSPNRFKHLVDELPTQFNEATQETIELIDVLWLKGNSVVAAFEIECTTSVYSGLLRMSDLVALQPNLDIKLYIVAPDQQSTATVHRTPGQSTESTASPQQLVHRVHSTVHSTVHRAQSTGHPLRVHRTPT